MLDGLVESWAELSRARAPHGRMGDEADAEKAEMEAVIAEVRRGFAGGFPRVPEAEDWLASFQQTRDR